MKAKLRYNYIDIVRGVAMMTVIWWHVIGKHTPWTDAWAMPVFFIIMGLFYKDAPDFKSLICKKANTLLVPIFFFSIPAFAIVWTSRGIGEVVRKIANPYANINGFAWFLVCMFWCYMFYHVIRKYSDGNLIRKIVLTMAVSLAGFYMSKVHFMGHRVVLPFFMSTSMFTMVFILIGDLIKQNILRPYTNKIKLFNALVFITLFGGGIFLIGAEPMEMIWNTYSQDYWIIVLNATFGSMAVIFIAQAFEKWLRVFALFGKHSMLLLLIHPYIIQLCILAGMELGVATFLVTLVVSTALAIVTEKYLPIMAGKKQIIKF